MRCRSPFPFFVGVDFTDALADYDDGDGANAGIGGIEFHRFMAAYVY